MNSQFLRNPVVQRNLVLAASLIFMIIGTGSVYFIVVALKPISLEFEWPRAVPSFAYALQYFAAGFGGILMGYWLDKLGMGVPAFIGGSMLGLGSVLTSYVSSPWHLYVIYGLVMGLLGRSTLFTPLTANITLWFEHNKSRAVGIVGSGQALAGAVWPPIFQYCFDWVGWRQTAFWYGIFCLLTMLPLALILKQKPPENKVLSGSDDTGNISAITASESLLNIKPLTLQVVLSVASIGCCVAMALPLAHLIAHVSDLGYDYSVGAQLLSLMLAAAGVTAFFGVGFLGRRYGGLRTIFIFSSIQATFLAALIFVDNLFAIYLVAICFGVGYGGVLPCYPVIVREYLPVAEVGRRTAVVILCAGGGMALGSWLGGELFDATGSYTLAFAIGVGFNLFNLLIIGNLISRGRSGRSIESFS
ncbi:MAG: MFS transporter [Rhodospirillaceae bacterium]|nr:MFS transporter [Rhodospirillaceae bacterium]|tara:strand:+ start:483 stop:1733 length:1251 start_codon:yes stop_codon:yes gene_type:complete